MPLSRAVGTPSSAAIGSSDRLATPRISPAVNCDSPSA
jgi:hypothetical protein